MADSSLPPQAAALPNDEVSFLALNDGGLPVAPAEDGAGEGLTLEGMGVGLVPGEVGMGKGLKPEDTGGGLAPVVVAEGTQRGMLLLFGAEGAGGLGGSGSA